MLSFHPSHLPTPPAGPSAPPKARMEPSPPNPPVYKLSSHINWGWIQLSIPPKTFSHQEKLAHDDPKVNFNLHHGRGVRGKSLPCIQHPGTAVLGCHPPTLGQKQEEQRQSCGANTYSHGLECDLFVVVDGLLLVG